VVYGCGVFAAEVEGRKGDGEVGRRTRYST